MIENFFLGQPMSACIICTTMLKEIYPLRNAYGIHLSAKLPGCATCNGGVSRAGFDPRGEELGQVQHCVAKLGVRSSIVFRWFRAARGQESAS